MDVQTRDWHVPLALVCAIGAQRAFTPLSSINSSPITC